jgi:hypothetical protein
MASEVSDDSIYGTHSVVYEPVNIGGLEGCILIYRAIHPDHAYRGGKAVVIFGHIGVLHRGGTKPVLALKIKVPRA